MTDIYLADFRIYDTYANEPPRLDPSFTSGEDMWIWPALEVEDFNLPERGDYIVFIRSFVEGSRLHGVGQVYDISFNDAVHQVLRDAEFEENIENANVLRIVNYQQIRDNQADFRYISEILGDKVENAKGKALWHIPPEVAEKHGFNPPLLGLSRIDGIPARKFTRRPGDPEGGRDPRRRDFDNRDDDGDGTGIDRTGPLLEQQYIGRDAIREASISGLQITILLFGVIVAGLSFLRDALRSGAVEVSGLMLLGTAGIGVGAILSATIIIISTANPRPRASMVSNEQRATNAVIHGRDDRGRGTSLLEFSNLYHWTVNELRSSNAILGGLSGGAVGIALAGIFLIGSEVVRQIESLSLFMTQALWLLVLASVGLAFYAVVRAGGETETLVKIYRELLGNRER